MKWLPMACLIGLAAACQGETASTAPIPTCQDSQSLGCVYLQEPDEATCDPGALSAGWTDRALAELNRIRGLAGLEAVVYDAALEERTGQCALITAVNESANAEPDETATCYSASGADACTRSNLTLYSFSIATNDTTRAVPLLFTPEVIVRRWLMDLSGDPNLGHRRWILDPFLKRTAFSIVHTSKFDGTRVNAKQAATLFVLDDTTGPAGATERDFVAYPIGEFPADLVDREHYLSFSLLADRAGRAGNATVDLSGARVTVTGPDGPLNIVDRQGDNTGSGIPNHLRWLVDGLVNDVEYTVVIEDVAAPQLPDRYEYTFTLVSSP